jgi:hypothetical protein
VNLTFPQGIQLNGKMTKWTKTNPTEGNRWRKLSAGHRVLAFPVWLYCDDTSGNTSKKWNKHNSFLFTAAGLPRKFVHRESNIHFLSTSNIAPPLEMLDGIVDQLECVPFSFSMLIDIFDSSCRECQKRGIWAWDAEYNNLVLVIPSVLAMLGDNPMQSEFACHIGFRGKYFCRICWVKGEPEDENEGDASDASSVSSQQPSKTKKKKNESIDEMIRRITQFMAVSGIIAGSFLDRNFFFLSCSLGGLGIAMRPVMNCAHNLQLHQLLVVKQPSSVERQVQELRIHSRVLSLIGYLPSLPRRAGQKQPNK